MNSLMIIRIGRKSMVKYFPHFLRIHLFGNVSPTHAKVVRIIFNIRISLTTKINPNKNAVHNVNRY